jgi:hypothetical protein
MRDAGATEVGGFGIAPGEDLLFVQELRFVKQTCTAVTVAFDDVAVAEFFEDQVDRGLRPAQFARIWIHTHPGKSAEPSCIDEETFDRVFGRADWALMFILAQAGETYSRLQFNVGPRGSLETAVQVDFTLPFRASDAGAWAEEYQDCVQLLAPQFPADSSAFGGGERLSDFTGENNDGEWLDAWSHYLADESMLGEFDFLREDNLDSVG